MLWFNTAAAFMHAVPIGIYSTLAFVVEYESTFNVDWFRAGEAPSPLVFVPSERCRSILLASTGYMACVQHCWVLWSLVHAEKDVGCIAAEVVGRPRSDCHLPA